MKSEKSSLSKDQSPTSETDGTLGDPVTPEGALDFMWQAFSNLNEWVRFSDAKAATVLAADSAIAGLIAAVLASSQPSMLHYWLCEVWMCCIVAAAFYSAAYALFSLMPQLKFPSKTLGGGLPPEESSSLVFFMDIDRKFPTWRLFHSTIQEALSDPERAVSEISQQVWCNSRVAATKYARVEKALYGLSAALFIGFGGVIVLAIYHLARQN